MERGSSVNSIEANANAAEDFGRATTACSSRRRSDVNRWVEMLSDELQADDDSQPKATSTRPLPGSRPDKNSARDTVARNTVARNDAEQTVDVAIEFGRTLISDASSNWAAGSLVRLDQLADEPLDVVIAGRLRARGELVVIEGKIGVRIVEVLACVLTWFVLNAATIGLADERPRENRSLLQIETEAPEVFDTPFGQTRGRRSRESSDTDSTPAVSSRWSDSLKTNNLETNDTAPRNESRSVPLTRPTSSRPANRERMADGNRVAANSSGTMWNSAAWSLLVVVGLIVATARWLKSHGPAAIKGLPSDVLHVLGRQVIDQRTSILLVRCGSRLLLLSSSPNGLQALTEITDPVEIDCLTGLCNPTERDQNLIETFRGLLHRPSKPTRATEPNPVASNDSVLSSTSTSESRWSDRLLTPQNHSTQTASPTSLEVRS